jgi:hypothetical protein
VRLLLFTWGVLGALFILKWGSGKPKAENRGATSRDGVAKKAVKHASIIAAIESIAEEQQAANANDTKNYTKTLIGTAVGAALVAAYTIITLCIFLTTRDQEHRQLRPQVGPVYDSFRLDCPECLAYIAKRTGPVPQPVNLDDAINYKLKNYGLSPAHHIKRCGNLVPFRNDKISEWTREQSRACDSNEEVFVNPTIWPGEEREQVSGLRDLGVAISAMAGNDKAYYIATIIYYDTFGDRHHTHICRIYARVDKPGRPPADELFRVRYLEWN